MRTAVADVVTTRRPTHHQSRSPTREFLFSQNTGVTGKVLGSAGFFTGQDTGLGAGRLHTTSVDTSALLPGDTARREGRRGELS